MGSRQPASVRPDASRERRPDKRLAISHEPAAEPAVRLVGVSKSFGKKAVLKEINLTVAPGELFEVTGPSGAGKTTLLRLLGGQLRPNSGEVWVRGRGLHRLFARLARHRRDVAFVFQEQRLLPRLTALENIVLAVQVKEPDLPMQTIRQRAMAALESVHLGDRRKAYPHQLSAGERQRIAVARALATRPRVLLADEPTNSLDDENAGLITRLLADAAAEGTTVIVATHHHSFPATRVLRLPAARVMTNGARKNGHSNGHANGQAHANGKGNGNGHAAQPAADGNGHANATQPRKPLWRLIIPVQERPHRATRQAQLPIWRRGLAFAGNSYRLVLMNGLRSWSRDLRTNLPVMGTIALVLTFCGTLALVGVAVERVVADQASQASVVRIYLAPDATTDAVAALKQKLQSDPRVASVKDVSPEEALKEASSRPGLDNLASLSSTNPFPASLDVKVKLVTKVAAVAGSVKGDPAVDPAYPTSYDPDTYSRLRHVAEVAGAIVGGILLLFAVVAYAVIANAMRGVAGARRQEVAITRLLGARGWMLRGPFVVEGLTTGALAGALAAAVVAGAYLVLIRFEAALYAQVLPGVDGTSVRYVLAAVIAAGLLLGAATAMFGFRRARV